MIAGSPPRSRPSTARPGFAATGAAGLAAFAAVGPDLPGGFAVCPVHVLLGIDCPACGGTRGLQALAAGDVAGALGHNLLLAVAVPILVIWWSGQVREVTGRPALRWPTPSRRTWTWAVAAIVAFTVLRNLPVPGLTWLDAA